MVHQASQQPISLALWKKTTFRRMTRLVSLVLTLAFVMPSVGWAFDIKNYQPKQSASEIKLRGPGSKQLAASYQMPPYLGKLVEASSGPNKLTFILIQDLHCNYEIQNNIRSILARLNRKYPDLDLVAVEGASGVVPTYEFSSNSNREAKLAVADYFVRQGKLTGADSFTICDEPDIELFGAEDETLYSSSIALVQEFSNEENRGVIFELLDQLEAAQKKHYNKSLLGFENSRQSYQKGDLSQRSYRSRLLKAARALNIQSLNKILTQTGSSRSLDSQQREAQVRILESKIRQALIKNNTEKYLDKYQRYVELYERMINVSASPEDLKTFRSTTEQYTIINVADYLRELLSLKINIEADLENLENSLDQALDFYVLAEKRNAALLNNTLKRARARGERRVAMISGGFHTDAISELIRKRGYSYVTIRPQLSGNDVSSVYFDRLLYPDQPTEFERMVTYSANQSNAIAVPNFLLRPQFRVVFSRMIDVTKTAMAKLRGQKVAEPENVTVDKVDQESVRVSSKTGGFRTFVLNLMGRNKDQMNVMSEKQWNNRTIKKKATLNPIEDFMTSSAGQSVMLGIGGMSLVLVAMAGFGIISLPIAGLLAVGITTVGTWWAFSQSGGVLKNLATPKGILGLALLAGVLFFNPIIGGALNDLINNTVVQESAAAVQAGAGTQTGVLIAVAIALQGVLNFASKMLKVRPRVVGKKKRVRTAVSDLMKTSTGERIKAVANVSPLSIAPKMAMLADGKLFNLPEDELIAKMEAVEAQESDSENGIPVEPNWTGEGDHAVFVTLDDIKNVMKVFENMEMSGFENILPISFFKEPVGGVSMELDVGPLFCKPITKYSLQTFNKVAKDLHGPEGADFIEKAFKASADPRNERLFVPRVIIRHQLKKSNMEERIVYNYEPSKFKAALQRIGAYESMFDEIVNSDFKEEVVEDMEAAVEISEQMPVTPTFDLAKNTILYGVLHEISHTLVLHMPVTPEDHKDFDLSEDTFFDLLRDNVPNLEVDDLKDSVPGRLMFKNWSKALRGVKHYRERMLKDHPEDAELYANPSPESQRLAIKAYATEMFCDLFPMYLMEQAGMEHPYSSEYGELMTQELRTYFEEYFKLIKWYYKENRLLVFSDEHLARSGMNEARAFTAALLMPTKGKGNPLVDATGLSALTKIGGVVEKTDIEYSTPRFIEDLPMEETTEIKKSVTSTTEVKTAVGKKRKRKASIGTKVTGSGTEVKDVKTTAKTPLVKKRKKRSKITTTANQSVAAQPRFADKKKKTFIKKTDNKVVGAQEAIFGGNLFGDTADTNNQQTADLGQVLTNTMSTPINQAIPGRAAGTAAGTVGNQLNVVPSIFAMDIAPGRGGAGHVDKGQQLQDFIVTDLSTDVLKAIQGNDQVYQQVMADQRATFVAGKVMDLAATVGAGETITVGFDSPILADAFSKTVKALSDADPESFGKVAKQLEIRTFPAQVISSDGLTETYNQMPKNGWTTNKGFAVFSAKPATAPSAVSMVLRPEGRPAVVTEYSAIPMSEAKKAFQDTADWNALNNAHNSLIGDLQNADQLQEFFLVDPNSLSDAQKGLLKNFDLGANKVKGFKAMSDSMIGRIPLKALQAAAEPAFKKGEKEVVVAFNGFNYVQAQTALGYGQLDTINFGANTSIVTSSYEFGYDVNALFVTESFGSKAGTRKISLEDRLREEAKRRQELTDKMAENVEKSAREAARIPAYNLTASKFNRIAEEMPVGVGINGLVSDLTIETLGQERAMIAYLRNHLAQVLGERYVRRLSDNDIMGIADEMNMLDEVTVTASGSASIFLSSRLHGKRWERMGSLFGPTNPLYYFKAGRMPIAPVEDITAWKPVVEKTIHIGQKGMVKLFSALLLGFAAGALVLDAIVDAIRTPRKKGQRLPLLNFFSHPSFRKAIKLMAMTVMGRKTAHQSLAPVVQQQIQDMQLLAKNGMDLATITTDQVPQSLKYSQGQFKQFKAFLEGHPAFRLIMNLVRVTDLGPLYPELFVLLSEGNNLQAIMWYIAPAETLEKQFNRMGNMDIDQDGQWDGGLNYNLGVNLNRTAETARAEMKNMKQELDQLIASGKANESRLAELQTGIKDRLFTLSVRRTLNLLKQDNNNRNVKRVIRSLLRELGREDVNEGYKEDVLKLFSLIEPFQQRPIQIRTAKGKIIQTMLPVSLVDSTLRDNLIFFMDVFDMDGKPLLPLRRRILRRGASA